MTVRLVLATIVGACGVWLLLALHDNQAEVVTGLGLLFSCFGLVVDHKY